MPTSEDQNIEYKSILNDSIEKEVVAFLNSKEGGQVYLGYDSDGSAIGLENIDEVQRQVLDRIKSNILPTTLGLFDVIVEHLSEISTIHIIVTSGSEKPYYLRKKGMSVSGCYIRIGSSSHPMTTEMIAEMFSKRTRNSIKRIVSDHQNLTFEQLRIYYSEKGLALNNHFAQSLELLTDDGKFNLIADLLSDKNAYSVPVARFAGQDKDNLLELKECGECSLVKATYNVLDKLNVYNTTFTKITYPVRLERNMIDPTALREAVINAFVHNDYSREVMPSFFIFSNRLVIQSYGGLVEGLSQEDFFAGLSMPRNRELMRIFKDLELVERLGSGIERILKIYDPSIFAITPNYVQVSFPFAEAFSDNKAENDQANTGSIGITITQKSELLSVDDAIVLFLREKSTATINEIADKVGISRRTVLRKTKELQEAEKIRRVGSSKSGHWEVLT